MSIKSLVRLIPKDFIGVKWNLVIYGLKIGDVVTAFEPNTGVGLLFNFEINKIYQENDFQIFNFKGTNKTIVHVKICPVLGKPIFIDGGSTKIIKSFGMRRITVIKKSVLKLKNGIRYQRIDDGKVNVEIEDDIDVQNVQKPILNKRKIIL